MSHQERREAKEAEDRVRRLTGGTPLGQRQFNQRVQWGEFSPDGRDLR